MPIGANGSGVGVHDDDDGQVTVTLQDTTGGVPQFTLMTGGLSKDIFAKLGGVAKLIGPKLGGSQKLMQAKLGVVAKLIGPKLGTSQKLMQLTNSGELQKLMQAKLGGSQKHTGLKLRATPTSNDTLGIVGNGAKLTTPKGGGAAKLTILKLGG